jgi:hypothetical protein
MRRIVYIEQLLGKSFWSIAVLAVIAFTPSSGLISLTIPDEPYSGIVSIPDTLHATKRASDDSYHAPLGILAITFIVQPPLFFSTEIRVREPITRYAFSPLLAQIRAPPDMLS